MSSESDSIAKEKTPGQVAMDMRKSLISYLQNNLIINGCQLT